MKSAYELAMERLKEQDPEGDKPVSEETKTALAAIDEKFKAKVAEREIFLNEKLHKALSKGAMGDAADLKRQMSSERVRLEEERESAKDKIRQAS